MLVLLLDNSMQRNQQTERNSPTISSENLMKIKTNVIVGILLILSIVQVISLISAEKIFNRILVIIINTMILSLAHLWILRSEEIFSYVKRKIKVFYESYIF